MPSSHVACAHCARPFVNTRANRRFCSTGCRKAAYKDEIKVRHPELALSRPTQVRRTFEKTESMEAIRLAYIERCRLGEEAGNAFLEELIDAARGGNSKLREILTNRLLKSPRRGDPIERMRGFREAKTLGEIADDYTQRTWGCSIEDAIFDRETVVAVPRRDLGCSRQVLPARLAAVPVVRPADHFPLIE